MILSEKYYTNMGLIAIGLRAVGIWNVAFVHSRTACGDMVNWPPCSPDFSPLDYHVRGHMKTMVSENMVDTSDELQQQIFDAARQVSNNTDICKVMCVLLRMARSKTMESILV